MVTLLIVDIITILMCIGSFVNRIAGQSISIVHIISIYCIQLYILQLFPSYPPLSCPLLPSYVLLFPLLTYFHPARINMYISSIRPILKKIINMYKTPLLRKFQALDGDKTGYYHRYDHVTHHVTTT